MSRFVVPKRPGLKALGGESPDGPAARIVKYVPAEIVAIYIMIYGSMVAASPSPRTGQQVMVGLIVLFTLGVIAYIQTRGPSEPSVKRAHLIVSPLAFVAWSYPIASGLLLDWFNGILAIMLQAVVLLLALVIAPSESPPSETSPS